MDNKILFIVEGKNDEVRYIERLFKVSYPLQNYEIVPYKTNLHNLTKQVITDGKIDDSLDIRLVLKENEKDPEIKAKLSQNFSDIIMVFDFEPQQDIPRFEDIRKMLEYFNSSTESGKLYINYPMMQSYRHFAKLPDKSFNQLMVSKQDSKKYKEIVNGESKFKNIDHHSYQLFVSIAFHHLVKLNYVANGIEYLPDIQYIRTWKQENLFDIQLQLLNTSEEIYVINTFALYLVEYNPENFYNQIKKHSSRFSIY